MGGDDDFVVVVILIRVVNDFFGCGGEGVGDVALFRDGDNTFNVGRNWTTAPSVSVFVPESPSSSLLRPRVDVFR